MGSNAGRATYAAFRLGHRGRCARSAAEPFTLVLQPGQRVTLGGLPTFRLACGMSNITMVPELVSRIIVDKN